MNLLTMVLFRALRITIALLGGMTLYWLFYHGTTDATLTGLSDHLLSTLTAQPLLWGAIWVVLVGGYTLRDLALRPKKRAAPRPGMVD